MKRYLQTEIRKALCNRYCLWTMGLLAVLAAADALSVFSDYSAYRASLSGIYADGLYVSNPALPSATLFNSWLGGRATGFAPTLFYFGLPLFAALPYAWTYADESGSGYHRCVVSRLGKGGYFFGKYVAVFLSGMTVVLIPLVFNLLLVACVMPAYPPDLMWSLYYAVSEGMPFSRVFYSAPQLYVCIYLLLPALYAGLWACVSLCVSYFVKNRFVILFGPFIALLFLIHIAERAIVFRVWVEVSPLNYVRGVAVGNNANGMIIGLVFGALLLCTILITAVKGRYDEIY